MKSSTRRGLAGLAVADINNDGLVDAVVSTSEGPAHIILNETRTSNHWLILNLTRPKSNRDAIGAEVKVVTTRGTQHATVTTASSYRSSGDKRVHFGLGAETTVQKVEIRWPSGVLQMIPRVKLTRSSPWTSPDEALSGLLRVNRPGLFS